jgi:hypothetical protein
MLYFFDCEFMQCGSGMIDLISIGIVSEDGREIYLESSEFDPAKANVFVRTNVLPKLGPVDERLSRKEIRDRIFQLIGKDSPTWMAYYSAYDFVCLAELFGSFDQLPKGYPKLCWDLKCEALKLGVDDLPHQATKGEHNSLADAKWLKEAYFYLKDKHGLTIPEQKIPV